MPIKNLTLGLGALFACGALAHADSYRVRNGDFDWAIARRYHLSEKQLHKLNPSVDWDNLKIGSKIHLPSGTGKQEMRGSASPSHSGPTHLHKVEQGENDWIIAHKAGITVTALHRLNSGIDLALIHPGQKLRVPGRQGAEVASVHKIHSTRVAVKGDDVTIRNGPGTDSDSICTVDEGTAARVLDRDGSWYKLKFPKGTVGWVRGDLLAAARVPRQIYVHHTHHRAHHSYVASHSSSHSHATLASYTALEADASDASALLDQARRMRGVRYAWGEASRSGTDCSGFTTQVFKAEGIRLPRTSREQATVGRRVSFRDLKPGDLVFFHTVHRGVSHVGIYMGHGQFIHASSRRHRVTVDGLSGYYARRLVAARRIGTPKKEAAKKAADKVAAKEVASVPPSAKDSDQQPSK